MVSVLSWFESAIGAGPGPQPKASTISTLKASTISTLKASTISTLKASTISTLKASTISTLKASTISTFERLAPDDDHKQLGLAVRALIDKSQILQGLPWRTTRSLVLPFLEAETARMLLLRTCGC
jgi:hypothetical protein